MNAQFLAQFIVKLIPSCSMRARLRQSAIVRGVIRWLFGGIKSTPYHGTNFNIYFDGYKNVGFLARNTSEMESKEKEIVCNLLTKLKPLCVWDIGANIGSWSLFLSSLCPDTKVVCFEPDPDNVKFLELNRNKNKITTWTIKPFAVSSEPCEMVFAFDPTTGSTGTLQINEPLWTEKYFHSKTTRNVINVTSIDNEVLRETPVPQFIKCDVEGHELSVFLGGANFFQEHHPVILFEDSGKQETADLLRSIGYKFFNLNGKEIETPDFNTLAVHLSSIDMLMIQ